MNDNIRIDIERYLAGQMSGEEYETFTKEILGNKELAAEVHLQEEVNTFLIKQYVESDPFFFDEKNERVQAFKNSEQGRDLLHKIHKSVDKVDLNSKSSTGSSKLLKLKPFILGAAAIAIVVFTVLFYLQQPSPYDLYVAHYDSSDLPSFTVRSDQDFDDGLASLQEQFLKGNNAFVIEHIQSSDGLIKKEPVVQIYNGLALANLGKIDQAIQALEVLENSQSLDASRAYWYKSLIYLKIGNTKMAKVELEKILSDTANYKFKKAAAILEKL